MSDQNNALVFLSETTRAIFTELREVEARLEAGAKVNRRYILSLAKRMGEQIPVAATETISEYLARVSYHLNSGEANAAMMAQANAGMLDEGTELAALEYQLQLIEERIEELKTRRFMEQFPAVAAIFEADEE